MMFTKLKSYLGLSISELKARDAALGAALDARLRELGVPIGDPIEPGGTITTPIGEIPMVRQLIEEARLDQVLDLAGISGSAAAAVRGSITPEAIDDAALQAWVFKNDLNSEQASSLGKTLERYFICEDSVPLVNAFIAISAALPNSTMALWAPSYWQAALAQHSTSIPEGMTAAMVAEVLARRLEVLYPTMALLGRIPADIESLQKAALDALVVLQARNPRRFDGRFGDLDLQDATAQNLSTLEVHWNVLMKMVRGYPGLGLAQLFDDVALSTGQRYDQMHARIGAFVTAVSNAAGPAFRGDALALDLSHDSQAWPRFNLSTYAEPVKATVRAYQRMRVVGKNIDVAATLVAAGYASAMAVARARLETIQALPGLAGATGERVWDTARQLSADAALFVAGLADQVGGAFDPDPTRPLDSVGQSFATLDGYASLFGNQSYCNCAHCASILGPAAYFVDLMQFVKDETSGQLPVGDRLTLKARRPDLWSLPLTCSATTDLVPTLTIVNEVLENVIARAAAYAGDYSDRTAVEALVYQGASGLPGATRSFAQPFAAGLAQTSAQLAAFGVERPALAAAVGAVDAQRRRVTLGLTAAWESLITTPRTTVGAVSEVYGYAFAETSGVVGHVDATVLAPAMGLDRDGLGVVVGAWFVRQGVTPPTIDPDRRNSQSVQNDMEWVNGLTVAALDRMHRLVRLASVVGLPVAQVDRLLRVQGDSALTSVESFADYRTLSVRFGAAFSEDDAASLAGPLDDVGLARFNRGVRDPAAVWPSSSTHFTHPGLVSSGVAAGSGSAVRLASALGLSDSATLALIRYLAPHLAQESSLGFDPDATNEAARYFVLTAVNLSLLDRHARLCRLLGVTADELGRVLGLAGISQVTSLAGAVAAAEAVDAWRASGRSLDALAAATGGAPRNPGTLLDVGAAAAAVRSAARAGMLVGDELFAAAYGMSIDASREVLAANAGLFAISTDGRRVVDAVDLDMAVIIVPPGSEVVIDGARRAMTTDDVTALLAPHTARGQLVRGLATATGRDDDEIRQLVRLAGVPIDAVVAASVRDASNGDRLEVVIAAVTRVDVATRGWSTAGLAALADAPALFGPGAWPTINATLPAWPRFTFAQATALGRAAARGNDPHRQDGLLAVAIQFDPATATFAPSADGVLAAFLGTSPATIAGLRGATALPAGVVAALDRLAALVRIADRLGVDGGALKGLVSDVDSERAAAAAAIEHAAELRAERDAAEASRLRDARGTLREQKRDALVDFLLRPLLQNPPQPPEFADRADLSSYLLVDVDAGGCATTSRVVAATNAVQEYVTRITLGLERSDIPPGAPGHFAVALSDAGTRSWEWRRAYRVWEANRKVFLWPENYLEPSLRDDKTHLFTELEDALGQSDLDEASILAAYATYLQGLDELTSLKIAGAYHDISPDGDVLHLIGVTASDPATFYYRSVTDLASVVDLISRPAAPERATVWGNWQKLDLAAPSRYVSPVVYQGRLTFLWAGVTSRPLQKLTDGAMGFAGYRHSYALSMAILRPDGTIGPEQRIGIPRFAPSFDQGPGVLNETLLVGVPAFSHDGASHGDAPVDGYTLHGAAWQRVVPTRVAERLALGLRNHRFVAHLDPYDRAVDPTPFTTVVPPVRPLICALSATPPAVIYRGEIRSVTPLSWNRPPEVFASALSTDVVNSDYERELDNPLQLPPFGSWTLLARSAMVPDAISVPGMLGASIVSMGRDAIALYPWAGSSTGRYVASRLGTTVTQGLSRLLFERGIDGVLATAQQLALAESPLPMSIEAGAIIDRSDAGTVNFRGSFGTYLRELFFHIPMLVATMLAGRGRHADARRWFHRVFDPTATEAIDTAGVPTAEVAHRQLDRLWRFREFRGLDADRARDTLTDGAALAAYREDPFNPHAIARRRLTAYQRHAFARYVDNLFEWGDLLFAQFTRESVEEARGLYQLGATLLGKRPARLGDCAPVDAEPVHYQDLEVGPSPAEPIRIGAETEVMARRAALRTSPANYDVPAVATRERLLKARERVPWSASPTAAKPVSFGRPWLRGRISAWAPSKAVGAVDGPGGLGGRVGAAARSVLDDSLAASVLAQLGPTFCVPVNTALLARWDRVEDRLWKIHHCLDIDGVRRGLALFAPELDPMTRVAATALGLTPDDLVADVAREIPPYRFVYLIERAKGFASSLAGFGGALLGALERRDNEALSRLRQEQGLALARLTRRQRELDVDMARESLAALDRQIQSAEYRRDYYDELALEGLSRNEAKELAIRSTIVTLRAASAFVHLQASAARILPEIHAPWAVAFGGKQVGGALESAAQWGGEIAAIAEATGSALSAEAGYQRRAQGWHHQLQLAKDELASLGRQRQVAALRVKAAEQSLVAYDESLQQLEDVLAFERDRVTNLALHTRLAQGLKQLYRLAYGHALALARLAERAYLYERGDAAGGLSAGYWDASMGGLLAGERLLSDLQALDRRFLETNHRELEIDQPFALSQIDPVALWNLRQTGVCEFTVPEVAFDVAYPGHWKRRLRAVRLTIPCVTGPYVNVGATLTLVESQVRPTPTGALVAVPLAHGTTIATSSAQADGGVFELSFRDERYLPFEGQGAVSTWRLELPGTVRGFDYGSISDVVVSLAYNAKADAVRRGTIEAGASTAGSILNHYTTTDTTRIVSLREELGASFVRLLRSPAGTAIAFELTDDMLAPVFRTGPTDIVDARVAVRLAKGIATVGGLSLRVDGALTGAFASPSDLGDLPVAPVAAVGVPAWTGAHTLELVAAGAVAGDPDALDPAKVLDILLVTTVRLA